MLKIIILSMLLFSLSFSESLKNALESTILTNPKVNELLENFRAAQSNTSIAQSGFYPKLTLSYGMGRELTEKTERKFTDTIPLPDTSVELALIEASATYTHNLFNGFKTLNQTRQASGKATYAAYKYIESIDSIAYSTAEAYVNILKSMKLLNNAQDNVNVNKEVLSKVQRLYNAGLTTLSEVNKIQSSLALARSNYIVEENNLLNYQFSMHKILGHYLNIKNIRKPSIKVALPDSIEKAADFALQYNSSILSAEQNVLIAQNVYGEKKGAFYPSLDIEISKNITENQSAIEEISDRSKAMVYVKWNLFNGIADYASVKQSVAKVKKDSLYKNEIIRKVIESLNLAWVSNIKLTEQLQFIKQYKNYAKQTLSLYSKEYDLGRRSLLDLLSSQNDYIGAKSQIIHTEHNLLLAKFRILSSMSLLVPNFIKNTNKLYKNVDLQNKTPGTIKQLHEEYYNKRRSKN